MRDAASLYVKLCDRLDSFAEFFSDEVFTLLNTWGQHPENTIKLKAYRNADGFYLSHHCGFRRHENIRFAPDFSKLLARGSWPGFEI